MAAGTSLCLYPVDSGGPAGDVSWAETCNSTAAQLFQISGAPTLFRLHYSWAASPAHSPTTPSPLPASGTTTACPSSAPPPISTCARILPRVPGAALPLESPAPTCEARPGPGEAPMDSADMGCQAASPTAEAAGMHGCAAAGLLRVERGASTTAPGWAAEQPTLQPEQPTSAPHMPVSASVHQGAAERAQANALEAGADGSYAGAPGKGESGGEQQKAGQSPLGARHNAQAVVDRRAGGNGAGARDGDGAEPWDQPMGMLDMRMFSADGSRDGEMNLGSMLTADFGTIMDGFTLSGIDDHWQENPLPPVKPEQEAERAGAAGAPPLQCGGVEHFVPFRSALSHGGSSGPTSAVSAKGVEGTPLRGKSSTGGDALRRASSQAAAEQAEGSTEAHKKSVNEVPYQVDTLLAGGLNSQSLGLAGDAQARDSLDVALGVPEEGGMEHTMSLLDVPGDTLGLHSLFGTEGDSWQGFPMELGGDIAQSGDIEQHFQAQRWAEAGGSPGEAAKVVEDAAALPSAEGTAEGGVKPPQRAFAMLFGQPEQQSTGAVEADAKKAEAGGATSEALTGRQMAHPRVALTSGSPAELDESGSEKPAKKRRLTPSAPRPLKSVDDKVVRQTNAALLSALSHVRRPVKPAMAAPTPAEAFS
ncbi:hypothetical protein CYMTET_23219 [Cymbomonas tetramitiformis]|uniref:Uncharacterized protein n=1 Tax=Cymbomonas tetramitiformis TaxID=36881 RepID=A0AAE0FYD1_9CHLO|nr:hypothetical protein CYMTET_23219 [Cymbomonas tetramitiformis]